MSKGEIMSMTLRAFLAKGKISGESGGRIMLN